MDIHDDRHNSSVWQRAGSNPRDINFFEVIRDKTLRGLKEDLLQKSLAFSEIYTYRQMHKHANKHPSSFIGKIKIKMRNLNIFK